MRALVCCLRYYCNIVPSTTSNVLQSDRYTFSVRYTPERYPHYVYLRVRWLYSPVGEEVMSKFSYFRARTIILQWLIQSKLTTQDPHDRVELLILSFVVKKGPPGGSQASVWVLSHDHKLGRCYKSDINNFCSNFFLVSSVQLTNYFFRYSVSKLAVTCNCIIISQDWNSLPWKHPILHLTAILMTHAACSCSDTS